MADKWPLKAIPEADLIMNISIAQRFTAVIFVLLYFQCIIIVPYLRGEVYSFKNSGEYQLFKCVGNNKVINNVIAIENKGSPKHRL
jgi:hypothetical protein